MTETLSATGRIGSGADGAAAHNRREPSGLAVSEALQVVALLGIGFFAASSLYAFNLIFPGALSLVALFAGRAARRAGRRGCCCSRAPFQAA